MNALLYAEIVQRALREDLGLAGDLTTDSIVSRDALSRAVIAARQEGRVAGIEVAAETFRQADSGVVFKTLVSDGGDAQAGQALAEVEGVARAILTAERTALNFLGRLCGIATATRDIVRAVEGSRSAVVCTRKTTPGLRALEKYAVRIGGGQNHRFGLADAVLIKDNHLAAAGGVEEAVSRVRRRVGHMVKVEVEVDTLEQLEEALAQPIDAVLLDNMSTNELKVAAELCRDQGVVSEASGGITPETAAEVAACGPDLISVGWITHSAPCLDVGLDLEKAH